MNADVAHMLELTQQLVTFAANYGALLPHAMPGHIGPEHEHATVHLPVAHRREAFDAFPKADWGRKANANGTFDARAFVDGVEVLIFTFSDQ